MMLRCFFTILALLAGNLAAQAFQVAITELLPDPDPAIGLPAEEFIELTNVSGKTIDISRWQLTNGRTRTQLPDSIHLPADSIMILCASRSAELFRPFGQTLGLSPFPTLSNESDTIILSDRSGQIVHAVAYSSKLYSKENQAAGRSLEMIDLHYSCSVQHNWAPSAAQAGGTPGQPNSLREIQLREHRFTLLYAYCLSDITVVLVFDDKIDKASVNLTGAIQTEPALQFTSIKIIGDLQNQLECTLVRPLVSGQIPAISADGISSCLHDLPGGNRRVKFGLADTGNAILVINEILFDPSPDGADYVEVYNPSGKVINLQNLSLANRNNRSDIAGERVVSHQPRSIYPDEYLVLTTNADWLSRQFLVKDPAKIVVMESLPSWPNDIGTVVLQNNAGVIIDELRYSSAWHFELLRNVENVALERKSPLTLTQDAANWFSAAMSSGYGTPGYVNSQHMDAAGTVQQVWLEPALFSPNGDGLDDLCTLRYRFNQPGFMLTAKIYNRSGRLVRTIVNNGLCGLAGGFPFDGKDDKKNQLPANVYIVATDIFSITGLVRNYRMAVTIGY